MNLDQQLRAALRREAEMQDAPRPPVDRLIDGGRVRRRRSNLGRLGVIAAAAALLVGVGAYGVTRIGSDSAIGPSQRPPTASPSSATPEQYSGRGMAIEPGTYRMMPIGADDAGGEIDADLTFDDAGWRADNYPVTEDASGHFGAVAVYRPQALAAGTGCLGDSPNTQVADTPYRLALQLAQLPRSTVVESPTPVSAFGRGTFHLRLRINNDCGAGVYRVADTPQGGHGISYSATPDQVVIDFWVVDLGGTPVVVDSWHDAGASSRLVARIDRLRDSINIVYGGHD